MPRGGRIGVSMFIGAGASALSIAGVSYSSRGGLRFIAAGSGRSGMSCSAFAPYSDSAMVVCLVVCVDIRCFYYIR